MKIKRFYKIIFVVLLLLGVGTFSITEKLVALTWRPIGPRIGNGPLPRQCDVTSCAPVGATSTCQDCIANRACADAYPAICTF